MSILSVSNIANRILFNARACNLNVDLDKITPGLGNCWYYAVIQQINRPEIYPLIDVNIRNLNHFQLRHNVSCFIDRIHNTCAAINQYKINCLSTNPNFSWEKYFDEQSTNGNFADEIFIMATAVFIGIDIHVNSQRCNCIHPVNIISKFALWGEDIEDNYTISDRPYLLIGHHAEHFQSLIPRNIFRIEEIQVESINNIAYSYADVVKKSKKDDNLHISFPPMNRINIHHKSFPIKQIIPMQNMVDKRKETKKMNYQENKEKARDDVTIKQTIPSKNLSEKRKEAKRMQYQKLRKT